MKKTILILIVGRIFIYADSTLNTEDKASYVVSFKVVSPNEKIIASLCTSTESPEEGMLHSQYLQIKKEAKAWIIRETLGLFKIHKISFVGNQHILITENSTIGTVSTLINIKTRKELFRIGGTSKYIKEGEHKGLFITYNRKGYFSAPKYGAFWVDELRDMHGELIEILSKPKDTGVRVSIKSILNTKLPHPLLRQSIDDYVYVER